MERTRAPHEVLAGSPGGFGDLFADGGVQAPVTVCHGTFSEQLPVGGETVSEIRAAYADRFHLDPLSQAVVDGDEVDDDTVVEAGQLLLFVRPGGEKGLGAPAARSAGGGTGR